MSRSYRTEKESVIAQKNISHDIQGNIIYPKIIERKPAYGDVHPIPKKLLKNLLFDLVPLEYLYGLKRVELRPRRDKHIGNPFGCYLRDEHAIILYSLPLHWKLDYFSNELFDSFLKFQAPTFKEDEEYINVIWKDQVDMSIWFYSYVFTHELGHHFTEQYKCKNGTIKYNDRDEKIADLHSDKLNEQFIAIIKDKTKEHYNN